MKLTVLGKYGPYPQDRDSACSGYLIEQDDTKLLIDCGPGTLGRLLSTIDIRNLNAIYLTHLHYDHTSDLLTMGYLLDDLNLTIPVYTKLTGKDYEKILFSNKHFKAIDINGSSNIKIGCLNLAFMKMDHPLVNHGVLIKGDVNLGITGDTKYCENVVTLAKKSDYLLADCSKPTGFKGPHMGAEYAFKIINETNTTILATHVTPNSEVDLFSKEKRIIPVEELKTYILNGKSKA